jgi:hypothetical protein
MMNDMDVMMDGMTMHRDGLRLDENSEPKSTQMSSCGSSERRIRYPTALVVHAAIEAARSVR